MHVLRHPTLSFCVRLIWHPSDQFPSDPPGSEPCWACITTISLSRTNRPEEQLLEFHCHAFIYERFHHTARCYWTKTLQLCLVKSSRQLTLYKLSSCLVKLEISFHPSHSLQWDHRRPAITSYCTFITVRLPVCEPPVTLLYLPATNQYGECGSISHGKECKKQPCCY